MNLPPERPNFPASKRKLAALDEASITDARLVAPTGPGVGHSEAGTKPLDSTGCLANPIPVCNRSRRCAPTKRSRTSGARALLPSLETSRLVMGPSIQRTSYDLVARDRPSTAGAGGTVVLLLRSATRPACPEAPPPGHLPGSGIRYRKRWVHGHHARDGSGCLGGSSPRPRCLGKPPRAIAAERRTLLHVR